MNTPVEQGGGEAPSKVRSSSRKRTWDVLLAVLLAGALVGGIAYRLRPRGEAVDPATLNLPFKASSARRVGTSIRAVLDDEAWWSSPEPQRASSLVRALDRMQGTNKIVVLNADGKVVARVSNKGGRLEVGFPP